MAAASALGNLGDRRAVEPLIEALDDEYWNVKQSAALALGNLGDIRAIRPLIRALGEDEFAFARLAAASALSKLGEKKWETIVKGDREDYKRLGNSGDHRAFEPLVKALKDKDWYVRKNAASALGNLGDKHAIEPLMKAYDEDIDKNVKMAIFNALKKLQLK
jgi:HEAT repeat protein